MRPQARAVVTAICLLVGGAVAAPALASGVTFDSSRAGRGGLVAALDPPGTQSFVQALYTDFLNRPPTSTELAHWAPRLLNGEVSRLDLAKQLSRSDEWLTTTITAFYRDTLRRDPEPAGLANWIRVARAGMPVAEIAAGFYASDEYFQTIGGSNREAWVRDLYRKLLLREGEQAGVDHWLRTLGLGVSRSAVAFAFYQSQETLQVRIDALYQKLLGRRAEPGGLASWSPFVRDQGDLVLAAAIAASDEYSNRASSRFPSDGTPPPGVKVVGSGTPSSCTSSALATAVRSGGYVMFNCGPGAVTITVSQTLYTCNTTTCQHPWRDPATNIPVERMTLDGGGLVTLSGGGVRGIFYANACEESFGWLSSGCNSETRPHITFRNITFADGNAQTSPAGRAELRGGGAIAMRGGRLTLDHVTFRNNRCIAADSDAGGGAVRVTLMTSQVEVLDSVFETNRCANGGALSSLHASMYISGSTFTGNTATGYGASSGLGGNGGAIYFDGTSQNVTVVNSTITGNVAPEGGPGIFYVSNNRTGSLTIQGTTITGNTGQRFHTPPYRNLYFLGRSLSITGSAVE